MALLLRTLTRLLLVVATAAFVLVSAAPAGAGPSSVQLTADEAAHLDLVNDYRRQRGLPALQVDAAAQQDARRWAAAMEARRDVGHDPGLGTQCASAGDCLGWAENVGMAGSHERVFELFVGSSGHAANMRLHRSDVPFRVGIAVLEVDGRAWVVHRLYRCACASADRAASVDAEFDRARAIATALEVDLLGAAAARTDTLTQVLYGLGQQRAAQGLAYSDAWVGALVDGFYERTLGRPADPAGRAHWIERIRAGMAPADVAAAFYASDEYHRRAGGTDRAWVRDLYDALLGRPADTAGVDHWVGRIERGTSRQVVAHAFYQSVESRRVRVRALYTALLGRQPDADGLRFWAGELAHGHDVRLAIDLASSGEYAHRAVMRFG